MGLRVPTMNDVKREAGNAVGVSVDPRRQLGMVQNMVGGSSPKVGSGGGLGRRISGISQMASSAVSNAMKRAGIKIDSQTGKNIAKNTDPGKLDPTGMTSGINRGVSNLSVNKTPAENVRQLGQSVVGKGSVVGQALPGVMGYQNTGAGQRALPNQNGMAGAGSAAAPKGFSLAKDSGEAPSIGANESITAATSPISRRYDLLQSNLRGREQAQQGIEQDAIARRFASMGASGSGAALKNMSLAANAGAKRFGEASNALAAQQSADQQAAIEAAQGRNMQRDAMRQSAYDAAQGRDLSREQLALQRELGVGELGLNQYITAENLKQVREDERKRGRGLNPLLSSLFPS